MNWRPAGRENGSRFIEYLKKDEWRHVALSARVITGGPIRFGGIFEGRLWIREKRGEVSGGLFVSRYGAVLSAFDPSNLTEKEEIVLRKILLPRRDRLFSILGMREPVMFLEKILDESPIDFENYRMLVDDPNFTPKHESDSSLVIRQAAPEHLDRLWPLEKAYQYEEVLRKGSRLNERQGRRMLTNTLLNQKVLYARMDGEVVAKAGTNARGWLYDQIGGVFVVPEYRNRGIGRRVMAALLQDIRKENRRVCLFVKESNQSALKLYQNLGFQDHGAFRISYWS